MSRVKLMGADPTCDQINDWFRIGTQVRVATIPQSQLGGYPLDPETGKAAIVNYRPVCAAYRRNRRGTTREQQTAYAEYYQNEETAAVAQQLELAASGNMYAEEDGRLSLISGLESNQDSTSTITVHGHGVRLPEGMTEETAIRIYDNYNLHHRYDDRLPITRYRQDIVDMVESQQVTVIEGETGCGKTTQVPQYILDHYAAQGRYCNIVVTQPRRIAAISIARRVCAERRWQLGRICGYQIGMDREASEDTRLLYCTTGVLLQKLINDKNMHRFTHVILDEVHERDIDTDFCLLLTRKLLWSNSGDVKVVLMSATMDEDLFKKYFARPVAGLLEDAPVIKLDGRAFDVEEYYLEDLHELGSLPQDADKSNPVLSNECFNLAVQLIGRLDEIEQYEDTRTGGRGSVLVFLPGLSEIDQMDGKLQAMAGRLRLTIKPLHSTITNEEQAQVFDTPRPGQRKVILSTNIAESSITVPDIRYVIDFCLTKTIMCDQVTNCPSLQLQWASKGNCLQRKGRAGRVAQGRVYRLVTYKFWHELKEHTEPEMQRSSLEQVVLQAKVLDLGEPKAILALAPSPPMIDDLERTILSLKEVGALSSALSDEVNPHDGNLTFLGHVLSSLPVDIRLGKLMLLGHVFGVLEETIIISACQSLKSFFARPFKAMLDSYRHKLAWANNSCSDSMTYLNAYQTWKHQKSIGRFRLSADELKWGRDNFIQIRRIKDVEELVKDLEERLRNHNIVTPPRVNQRPPDTTMSQSEIILKLVMCGAFYPNYFEQVSSDEVTADREISGYNPCTTVMVKGLPANQGQFYRQQIEDLFRHCDEHERKPRVHFEETRAFIEFHRDPADGSSSRILPAVYLALKLRQLPKQVLPLELDLIDSEMARQRFEEFSVTNDAMAAHQNRLRSNRLDDTGSDVAVVPQVALPPPGTSTICLRITEVVDCGRFWAQDVDNTNVLNNIQMHLQEYISHVQRSRTPMMCQMNVGDFCAAPYVDCNSIGYYRARITKRRNENVEVFFVDYGNTESMDVSKLLDLPVSLLRYPFQAFECELCKIKPSAIKCPAGHWTDDARRVFQQFITKATDHYATIFSVVHDVLRVDLVVKIAGAEKHVNQQLVDLRFADQAEESHLSHLSHQQREQASAFRMNAASASAASLHTTTSLASREAVNMLRQQQQLQTSDLQRSGNKVKLQGPWSSYEVGFIGCTLSGKTKPTRVERDSVNTVALCDDRSLAASASSAAGQCASRMMVASNVHLNPSATAYTAWDTTIMPNIQALLAIVAITFAPNVELRTDEEKRRYTGALCGLGSDINSDEGDSVFPLNDMEITFDSSFDLHDLQLINRIRMSINLALNYERNSDSVLKIQRKARQLLLELIEKRRQPVTPVHFGKPYSWQQVDPDDIKTPNVEELGQTTRLYTLHCGIELNEELPDNDASAAAAGGSQEMSHAERLRHHMWLKSRASRSLEPEDSHCKLCDKVMHTPNELYLHLMSLMHRRNQPVE